MNTLDYNPLDALFPSSTFNDTFPRPESVVTVEDEGDLIYISTGDDGLTLTPEEAEAVVAKLGFALQERSYES